MCEVKKRGYEHPENHELLASQFISSLFDAEPP